MRLGRFRRWVARLAAHLDRSSFAGLRRATRDDFRAAPWSQRLALIGVGLWLVYEWGPGNETLTPWILVRVIGHNHTLAVIPLTFVIGFLFTVLQQTASGFTALYGFSLFDRTSQAAWAKLRGNRESLPGEWDSLSWPARCSVVFTLGTTAVALIQVMTTGEVGVRRHARVIRSSAVLCATIVGIIGAAAATAAYLGRRVHALADATNLILRVLGNPLFWLGLLVVLGVVGAASRSRVSPTPSVAGTTEPDAGEGG